MALGRVVRTVATMILLGSVGASLLSSPCDLPRAAPAQSAVSAVQIGDGGADPCASGCKPDCFVCSRSEAAASAQFECDLPAVVAAVSGRDAHPIDGVLTLPYHPPHRLA